MLAVNSSKVDSWVQHFEGPAVTLSYLYLLRASAAFSCNAGASYILGTQQPSLREQPRAAGRELGFRAAMPAGGRHEEAVEQPRLFGRGLPLRYGRR